MNKKEKLMMTIQGVLSEPEKNGDDYFSLIKAALSYKNQGGLEWQSSIDALYECVKKEIITNRRNPLSPVSFGTSGWRGILGKDLHCQSVAQVTMAILEMYESIESYQELHEFLGVATFHETCTRGCVVGFDNRFCNEHLASVVVDVLRRGGVKVYYAGESTTGVLSAAVLMLNAAFSINLTPSHNPLEYGGFKFNGADAGPAASEVTSIITRSARRIIEEGRVPQYSIDSKGKIAGDMHDVEHIDSLSLWKRLVEENESKHGLNLDDIVDRFIKNEEVAVVIDSVHGASRLHIHELFNGRETPRLRHLRGNRDVTFGGVSPEPSSKNLELINSELKNCREQLTLGVIIDPDGDRIRFTDGKTEIGMNQFGAMSYHFLHQIKGKKGMVAKTVASSNLANAIAKSFDEKIFEPRVGFKEFKPVIGQALVCFEESDGISIIGHTPEKDAYIGLILALEMILVTGKNLGEYLSEIITEYGAYFPQRDGIEVSYKGDELLKRLAKLERYTVGEKIAVGDESKTIAEVINIDGRKMIFEDGSWMMIRPSGTEPKVRFYVESRTADGAESLVKGAISLLTEAGLVEQ